MPRQRLDGEIDEASNPPIAELGVGGEVFAEARPPGGTLGA